MFCRYYRPQDMKERGIGHVKLSCGGGGQVPSEEVVARFNTTVDTFKATRGEEELLGVHCTHGVNRSHLRSSTM